MRFLTLALVLAMGGIVVWGSADLPQRGDPNAPASVHDSVSVYYIENAYTDSRTPNMVTAVLADYRGFDTFGEAVVVVAAALSCLLILLRRRDLEGTDGPPKPSGTLAASDGSADREGTA